MKKILVILGLGSFIVIWFHDLPSIIRNYHKEFSALSKDISITTPIRFYNTFKTLSIGQYKIDKNDPGSRNCHPLSLDLPKEEYLVKLISDASYRNRKMTHPNARYVKQTTFTYIGARCTSHAKLINMDYKGNEAYATFACEQGDLVQEFTYSNTDNKCAVMEYSKAWGVKPIERTLNYTKSLEFF